MIGMYATAAHVASAGTGSVIGPKTVARAIEDQNRWSTHIYADLNTQADFLKEALGEK